MDRPFLEAHLDDIPGVGVLAGVDGKTCEALAVDWVSGRWILKNEEYKRLVQQKGAVRIKSGTHVDRVELSLLKKEHLVLYHTGEKEELPEGVAWVTPKEGLYKSRVVCVAAGTVRTSLPPPL